MTLLESVENPARFRKIDIANIHRDFFQGLSRAILLNDETIKIESLKFYRNFNSEGWFVNLRISRFIDKPLLLAITDTENFFYVLITRQPRKIASSVEARVFQVYKSRYLRRKKRKKITDERWQLYNFEFPVQELDFNKLKPSISSIFQVYQRQLQKTVNAVKVAFYGPDDNELINRIKKNKKGIVIRDSSDPDLYLKEYQISVDRENITYDSLTGLNLPEIIREYRKKQIISEVIEPILYSQPDGTLLNIGYVQAQIKETDRLILDEAFLSKIHRITEEICESIHQSNFLRKKINADIKNITIEGIGFTTTDAEFAGLLGKAGACRCDLLVPISDHPIGISLLVSHVTKQTSDILIGTRTVDITVKKFYDSAARADWQKFKSMVSGLPEPF